MHCYGVAGSGKTHIAISLAEKFPFTKSDGGDANKELIKWHIQCSDRNHDVKKNLKDLADEMQRNSFIKKEKNLSIKSNLDKNRATELMQALLNCNAHVLILIEDPQDENELVRDLCVQLSTLYSKVEKEEEKSSVTRKIQMYITSRTKNGIFRDGETEKYSFYESEHINGFSEEEALEFLKNEEGKRDNPTGASEICKWFSCLPFGLKSAKEYCKEVRIDYKHYLKRIQKSEIVLAGEEKQFILENLPLIFSKQLSRHLMQTLSLTIMPYYIGEFYVVFLILIMDASQKLYGGDVAS